MSITVRFRPTGWTPGSSGILLPALPQSEPSFAVPTPTRTVNVSTQTELDSAFTDIQPGDEIVLDSATTWSRMDLPDHGGTDSEWCTLRGSSGIPAEGTRVTSTDTLATIQHDSNNGMIRVDSPVSGWYVYGLKMEIVNTDGLDGFIIQGGDRIVMDRCWVFAPGDPDVAPRIRRAVRMNGENCVIKNSRIEGIIWDGTQTQGISCWDGAGPYLIENNFIEAFNQCILFGGAAPASLADAPADITIRNNHLFRRPAWSTETGTIIAMEWKAGQRSLFEGNIVENDHAGFVVAMKAPEEGQAVADQKTSDITIRLNRYKGDLSGIGGYMFIRGASQPHTVDAEKVLIEDDWWDDHTGMSVRLFSAPDHITIRRLSLYGASRSLEIVQESPTGESPHLEIDRFRARAGSFGLWLTDDTFPNGFPDAYPNHTFTDYWQYWNDDGENNCSRHTDIPETLDQAAQDEFFCTQFAADIPDRVGADETAVNDAIAGVEETNLPS